VQCAWTATRQALAADTVLRSHYEVLSAAFSPDGSHIVTTSRDNTARIWDAATANEIAVLRGRPAGNQHEAVAPNGAVLLGFFLKPNRFAYGEKFFTAPGER
jgi:WD40 repeat protein